MELDQLKEKWITKDVPTYNSQELESIFNIRKGNILTRFKLDLGKDLIIAEVLAIGFILTLQVLDFQTSNFWSLMLFILAMQHLIIYSLQSKMIAKLTGFNQNVAISIQNLIKKLSRLLWLYRLWPPMLSLFLYTVYVINFSKEWSGGVIFSIGVGLAVITYLISNSLSAVLVRNHLRELKNISRSLETLKSPQ